jgi:hypothetical protein
MNGVAHSRKKVECPSGESYKKVNQFMRLNTIGWCRMCPVQTECIKEGKDTVFTVLR